jgi:hypothetical protein
LHSDTYGAVNDFLTDCALHPTGRRDRGSPDHPKRDTVLAAVKAWPGGAGARRTVGATAIQGKETGGNEV